MGGVISRPRPVLRNFVVALSVVLPSLLLAPTPALAVTVGTNVNINRQAGNQSEGTIAIDPTNPQRLFASSNSGNGLMMSFSTDGGATWTARFDANGGADGLGTACCDSSASWDAFGNLFLVYLDVNVLPPTKNGPVRVALSTDGGQNFSLLANMPSGSVDQPTVTTGAGAVWVTWTDGSDTINASGATVTGLGSANITAFSAPIKAGNGDFGDIAISPAGDVMVAYQRPHGSSSPSQLFVALKPAAQNSFNAESSVVTTPMSGFYSIPAQSSRTIDPEAGLAYDRSGGAHNGRVYFVNSDVAKNGDTNTSNYVRFSDDNGTTWSAAVKVNDGVSTSSAFLPRMVVDQTTGKLAVSWHDTRNSADNKSSEFWGATSNDGTGFSANFKISAGVSNAANAANGIDYGDYTGLSYQQGVFNPIWSDNSNSTGDNPDGANSTFDLYTASVVVTKRDTTLTYNGDTSGTFHKPTTLSAILTNTAVGSPINGATIDFTLGSQSCSGVTGASGQASCTFTINQLPGPNTVTATFAGTAIYNSSTTSQPYQINKAASHTTYTGPTTADFDDSFLATATLTEDGGAPISGRTVDFKLGAGTGTESCTGPTDLSGTASCTLTPNEAAGSYPIMASFAGDGFYAPSSDSQTFTITKEETTTTYTGPTVIANGVPTSLSGRLTEDGTTPISGRTLTMTLGSGVTPQSCVTGPTDATGSASCTIVPNQPMGPGTVTAAFLGDAFYLPSSDTKPTIFFAFLASGAFAIGDGNATVGDNVTFWGAQWAQQNTVSGGPAPNGFKGFASDTAEPPACGSNWTARPGNAGNPPDSVPAYMGVIVTSSVSKHGSDVSGNTVHIVVVKTDPGYAGNPGHAGTGTVVAVFC
jgi:Bacterial Ig-like domain (group 3)